mmetsp:Transcript_62221/g.71334  ORF Transcript_62221/g.71334 Transcript_62221/m.71334 type:complete len:160 (-) Transcript_62221:1918-2397(-)|eukprot:CAMPEP_0114982044 /NCGR_PEP_ID=MMETSP0216-20121206/5879_1 /TAXON_ID=223996 /ORGANISM="Protocruzia adherens, Strain Boccale" /LENGTH=159 /DNA_ID=CAMNT_0002343779 /DNA_START=101 /DNA_END=580 /DNA_ORIENTATION=+
MVTRTRLIKELKEYERSSDKEIRLFIVEDQLLNWRAKIRGPPDTPYEGGVFLLRFDLSKEYPVYPPKVFFETKIFHPNIHFESGEICLDLFKSEWIPAWTLESVCRAVISLLSNPNEDSPLNCDCGNLIRMGDSRGYRSLAKMYTEEYGHETNFEDRKC